MTAPSSSTFASGKLPESAIPIPSRNTPPNYLQSVAFGLFFYSALCVINATQFLILPFRILYPPLFERGISYTKLAFGRTLMIISQFFGPTKIVLSFHDQDGNTVDPQQYVKRDTTGRVVSVQLPRRGVWMSNHQVYADWLYLWQLALLSDLGDSIVIILKDSLKWIPIVGWGMQFFRFIFLARSWTSDRTSLARHLSFMSSSARSTSPAELDPRKRTVPKPDPNLLLLIFPEGTLISENTQPISRKYAEKNNFEDRTNVLLPRSTGLIFCLRALRKKEMQDLKLVDFTIGYPGVPPAGYGQRYYTLRSIFMQGVPPPAVHIVCTISEVPPLSSPPTSAHSTTINAPPPLGAQPSSGDAAEEASPADRATFDEWLRRRWAIKDKLMQSFYDDGDFVGGVFAQSESAGEYRRVSKKVETIGAPVATATEKFVEIPMKLRSNWELGDAFCWGAPFIVFGFAWQLVKTLG